MVLTATTDSLDIVLGAAITTNQLPFVVAFDDITSTGVTPTKNVSVTNSTTAVNLIAAPATNHQRKLRYCAIFNNDTLRTTVTIQFNDNGTNRKVFQADLLPGESIQYTISNGWQTFDNLGQQRIQGMTLLPSGLRMPPFYTNNSTVGTITLTSGTDFVYYLGKADRPYTTMTFMVSVSTGLGATITWAEAAIYKANPVIGTNPTLTPRCGYTDISGIINGTGTKTITITVSGVNIGDDLYLVVGTVTSGTNCIMQGMTGGDAVGSGFISTLTGSVRPSTNNSLSPTIQTATSEIWFSFTAT